VIVNILPVQATGGLRINDISPGKDIHRWYARPRKMAWSESIALAFALAVSMIGGSITLYPAM
jgi:hypothetical protein